jgi:hypothetical protein
MKAPTTGCFICDKHRLGEAAQGGLLYQDDLVDESSLDSLTANSGYLMVEPKRHAAGG